MKAFFSIETSFLPRKAKQRDPCSTGAVVFSSSSSPFLSRSPAHSLFFPEWMMRANHHRRRMHGKG